MRKLSYLWVVAVWLGCGLPAAHSQILTNNLLAWFKADAGITTNSGGFVTQWLDQSGNGFIAQEIGATKNPVYVTNWQAGLPALRFDGANDHLVITNQLLNLTGGMTVFILARNETNKWNGLLRIATSDYVGASDLQIGWKDGTTTNASGSLNYFANLSQGASFYGEVISHNAGPRIGSPYIYDVVAMQHSVSQRLNGVAGGTITPSRTNFLPLVSNKGAIGIGDPNAYLKGEIAEIIIYNAPLSAHDQNNVWAYLEGKYSMGIPEPSTLTLWGLGGILLLWRRRR